jgi:outer membrane protein OmpA-like peptidoglycan-associated protein
VETQLLPIIGWLGLGIVFLLDAPGTTVAQPPSYEFRVRGSGFGRIASGDILIKRGSSPAFFRLVVSFKPGLLPAGQGLEPGEGSWLDRGMRPNEATRIEGDVAKNLAVQVVQSLGKDPNAYWSFWIYNTNEGYFQMTKPPAPFGDTKVPEVHTIESDPTKEAVIDRINALPLASARQKEILIDNLQRARSVELITVIPFEVGRTKLRKAAVEELVKTFDKPEIRDKLSDPTAIIVLAGYADPGDPADRNLSISRERAETVSNVLKRRANLHNVIQTIGMGGTELLDKNRMDQNRAVEIWVVVPL